MFFHDFLDSGGEFVGKSEKNQPASEYRGQSPYPPGELGDYCLASTAKRTYNVS